MMRRMVKEYKSEGNWQIDSWKFNADAEDRVQENFSIAGLEQMMYMLTKAEREWSGKTVKDKKTDELGTVLEVVIHDAYDKDYIVLITQSPLGEMKWAFVMDVEVIDN